MYFKTLYKRNTFHVSLQIKFMQQLMSLIKGLIAGISTPHTPAIYLPPVPTEHVARAHSSAVTCMHRDGRCALLKLYF